MSTLSKTQLDKLGERLKKGEVTEDDLRLLDEFRKSFTNAYEFVVKTVKDRLKLPTTGRPAKSTPSIADKLKRETIRLTQIQDIAGCRLIVPGVTFQDEVVSALKEVFEEVTIVDRRLKPTHGYRAVHLIVNHHRKLVEIQIRTEAQHLWAELSEKLADQIDPALKYGGGEPSLLELLFTASEVVVRQEELELELTAQEQRLKRIAEETSEVPEHLRTRLLNLQHQTSVHVDSSREVALSALKRAIESFPIRKVQ